ncbi:MAG: hypothetical protein CFE36_13890 [Sphingomonadaceae bacterium PASS1]|jgi:AcrR family transcriptional regulator|nr:MAG: hypothetical protein CFE36_13890 [Sphingomonadaceae bacterium PASS1]
MEQVATLQKSGRDIVPRRRSGRPTADRVAEIDAAIRIAAQQIFFDVGFEAANMDAVAAAAHISKGTLYARYRSKEALFRAVIEDLFAKLSARAGERDHLLPNDLEKRLRHYAKILISVSRWQEYIIATRLVNNAAHAFPEIASVWHDRGTRQYVTLIAEDIDRLGALAAEGNIDPVFLANLFLQGIAGWYRSESVNGPVNEAEAEAYSDKVVRVIMTAIHSQKMTQSRTIGA